jgi:hypothetical protein
MAEDLRVPVSNIVRNVLEEAFSVVETVSENVGDLIGEVVDEAEAAAERIRRRKRATRGDRGDRDEDWEWAEAEVEDYERRSGSAGPAADAVPRAEPDEEVLGWQPMILAREQRCGSCGERLERGANAYAGVTARGIGARYLCESCLAAQSQRAGGA